MKKTIPTSIANTLFYIEEDAYAKIGAYLDSIKAYFKSNEDGDEIIRDIEGRVAEQLIEYTAKSGGDAASPAAASRERIVNIEHVDRLIKAMGTPEDFASSDGSSRANNATNAHSADGQNSSTHANSDSHNASSTGEKPHRKLYRDTEHEIIGGVCAGLAAFFGIEVNIIRAIFLISLLFGGSGGIVYFILWCIIPEAKTASQKLEMQGDTVTVESISEMIKKKFKEANVNKGTFRKILAVPLNIIRRVASAINRHILPFFGEVLIFAVGTIVTIAVIIAGVALMVHFLRG